MREICTSGLTSGDWKRGNGPREIRHRHVAKAAGNSYSSGPTATAPVVDSTAGAGWQVMHRDVDAEFGGETLQFDLPQPQS
jgi:hypothetical protein